MEAQTPIDKPIADVHAIVEYAAPELYARTRRLADAVLDERRLPLGELRDTVSALVAGFKTGVAAQQGALRADLKSALSGVDDALGDAARSAATSLKASLANGREFTHDELADSLERIKSLRHQLADAVSEAAHQSGGKLTDELRLLAGEFRANASATGEQLAATLGDLKASLSSEHRQLADDLRTGMQTGRERLADTASGLMDALADKLKRESARLRS